MLPSPTRFALLLILLVPPLAHADIWKQLYGSALPQTPAELESDLVRSCADLYREYSTLVPSSYEYRKDFFSRAGNRVAGAVGAFFTPAFAYWGYSSLTDYRNKNRISAVQARLTQLERAIAQKQCFVR